MTGATRGPDPSVRVGIVGAGTMGAGIAQVAATAGHTVALWDSSRDQIDRARFNIEQVLRRQVEKRRLDLDQAAATVQRIEPAESLDDFGMCGLVIEAIVEQLSPKRLLFADVESVLGEQALLATNTSSLSIAAIASACQRPERLLGLHFFNPAPLMPLVEVVPSLATSPSNVDLACGWISGWGKTVVVAQDTPGFIVNRVARPFYAEALRMFEEGVGDIATIDWAMREVGGFRMGPFELMDLIGNDINYTVTETIFTAFYYDPRFKPSVTQKRFVEAGRFGRKTGRGFYDYADNAAQPQPTRDPELGRQIVDRAVAMLINEAADAVFYRVASPRDIDLAMTLGVNYPKGLLAWCDEIGPSTVLARLEALQAEFGEDRYRPSPLLRRLAREGRGFFSAQQVSP